MQKLTVATLLAPSILPVYEAVTTALETIVGSTELVTGSYHGYQRDDYDVAFICGLPYVEFEASANGIPVAAPVLQGPRFEGRPIYFSDVVVHRSSTFESFSDLRGRSWAINEPLSQSGHGIVKHHLASLNERTGFFGEVIEAGFHSRAIELVRNGNVDGAAIDCQVLEVALRTDPELADSLRIIDSLGPSTIQPVTVSGRLDQTLRTQITDVITGIHRDPEYRDALAYGLVERFVAVGPVDYEDIRTMAATSAGVMLTPRG